MIFHEQETASIIKFVLDKTGELTPYYGNLPKDYVLPAVVFRIPDILISGDTLSTYKADYNWNIQFFGNTADEAYEFGNKAFTEIIERRSLVPYIDTEGEEKKQGIRINAFELSGIDECVVQLKILYTIRRPYTRQEVQKMQEYDTNLY